MFEAGHYALDVLWLFSNSTGLSVGGIGNHHDLIDVHIPGSPFAFSVEPSCGFTSGESDQANCMQSMAVSPYITRPPCGYAAGTSPGRWMRCDVCTLAAHPDSLACDCANAWNLVWVPYDCFLYHTSSHRHLWIDAHKSISKAVVQSGQCSLPPGVAFSGTSQQRTLFYRFRAIFSVFFHFSTTVIPCCSMIVSVHADHSIVTSRSQDDMTLESQKEGEPALLFHWSSPTFNKVCTTPSLIPSAFMRPLSQLIPGGYSGPKGRSGGLTKDELYEPSEEVVHTVRTPMLSFSMAYLLT